MEKFEEELKKLPVMGRDILRNQPLYSKSDIVELSEGWVSPETFELEENTVKQLFNENKQLKFQLEKQQPEIPEVPQFVADWYEKNKERLEIAVWDYICDFEHQEKDEFHEFMKRVTTKPIETIFSMKNGYTVAKEKRFYLKHKSVLIFDPDSDDSDVDELYLASDGNFVPYQHLAKIFTQQEIDSMETGSYERIEVGDD